MESNLSGPGCCPFCNSNDGPELFDMIFDPLIERHHVQSEWTNLLSTIFGDSQIVAKPLHPYFVDHYGYLLYLHMIDSTAQDNFNLFYPCHFPNSDHSWRERVEAFVLSCPAWNERTRPQFAGMIPKHQITTELLGSWSDWLSKLGVRVPSTHYELPNGITWEDFYKDSVHFPDRPAIAGPTFFFRTTTKQQEQLIKRYGTEAPTALYIVLLRIHEKSHFLQTGCPLINELSLSVLWGSFLTEFDQWLWQANSSTKEAFNLEWEYTQHVPLRTEQWAQVFTDSYLAMERLLGSKAPGAYDSLRKLSLEFFLKKSNYKQYVQNSCALLNEYLD